MMYCDACNKRRASLVLTERRNASLKCVYRCGWCMSRMSSAERKRWWVDKIPRCNDLKFLP